MVAFGAKRVMEPPGRMKYRFGSTPAPESTAARLSPPGLVVQVGAGGILGTF